MKEKQLLSAVSLQRNVVKFIGSSHLRTRLVLATLSGKTLKVSNIRSKHANPGLTDFEFNLLELFNKLTNGTVIEVSQTATSFVYKPGVLQGGSIQFDCNLERGIGYFLEPVLCLAPFCKFPLDIILRGVTNNVQDPSPDLLLYSAMPILNRFFVVDDGIELKIDSRGCYPNGGGQVRFKCRVISKSLKALQVTKQGMIKRIRGVAWSARLSPAVANRMVESAKGELLKFIPDVYIYTDHATGKRGGNSPGFGLTLTAETDSGVFLSAEKCSLPGGSKNPSVPEDLGKECSFALFDEIYRGGCFDSTTQSLILLLTSLSQKDVSQVMVGPLSNHTIHFLKHLKDMMGHTFKIDNTNIESNDNGEDEHPENRRGSEKVIFTSVGMEFKNIAKLQR